MEEPKLNEEELKGLSEEEKAKKIAELEKQKELYWKERYKRNIYEFGDYDGPEDTEMTPDVAKAVEEGLKKIRQIKEAGHSK
ncbi:MAG: hypothetical protein IJX20_05670 [Alphaproteobacteria bacterium]|nr:hypothetical protein [Alphaproteobacteria bacterium]MBQ8870785.1 hypothetical protein [Alphaproteobacteria bacterium]